MKAFDLLFGVASDSLVILLSTRVSSDSIPATSLWQFIAIPLSSNDSDNSTQML